MLTSFLKAEFAILDFLLLKKKVEQPFQKNQLWKGPTLNLVEAQREDRIRENFSEMEIEQVLSWIYISGNIFYIFTYMKLLTQDNIFKRLMGARVKSTYIPGPKLQEIDNFWWTVGALICSLL